MTFVHVAVPVHFLAPRSQLILSCLPHTVPVPEEYQDFPGSVQRDLRHEEERAVRGLRPLRRQGFWKGKTALLGDTEGDGGSSPSLCRQLSSRTAPNLLPCLLRVETVELSQNYL